MFAEARVGIIRNRGARIRNRSGLRKAGGVVDEGTFSSDYRTGWSSREVVTSAVAHDDARGPTMRIRVSL
jgi:hypothetical protein